MCEIVVKILERELENTGLIYIYREADGKWYAYEQSAFFLNQMMNDELKSERFVIENTLWLTRVEVDIDRVPHKHLVSVSAHEYVLRYVAGELFYDWLEGLAKEELVKEELA